MVLLYCLCHLIFWNNCSVWFLFSHVFSHLILFSDFDLDYVTVMSYCCHIFVFVLNSLLDISVILFSPINFNYETARPLTRTCILLKTVRGYRVLWTGMGAQLARDVPFSAICWPTLEPVRSISSNLCTSCVRFCIFIWFYMLLRNAYDVMFGTCLII